MKRDRKLGLLNMVVAAALSLACVGVNAAEEKKPLLNAQKPAATAPVAKPAAQPMDINSASEEQLATLDGIGAVRAKAIVKNRPYARKDDLVKSKVLSDGVYEKIKDQIIAKQK